MTPGDTVITPEGKEGIVYSVLNHLLFESDVTVKFKLKEFDLISERFKTYPESELKVKEEKK